MESLIGGKSRQIVLAAIKSLHPILLKTWPDRAAYREEAAAALTASLGTAQTNPNEANALADQILLLTSQIRALQLRHIETAPALVKATKTLESTFAESPLRLGCLALAADLHHSAIGYLESQEGRTAYTKLVPALDKQRVQIARRFHESEQINLDQIEAALTSAARSVLGKTDTPFHHAALAGSLVEKVRRQARLNPSETAVPADFADNSPDVRLISALEDAVRRAELNEARQRFAALNEYEKGARYEALRKVMLKQIDRIAPHAPAGFDAFCQAVESSAYPYPSPREWVRVFLKPLHTNAEQSSTFDKCRTEKSVELRYKKVLEEKGANPLMLHLARAFALAALKIAQAESIQHFIDDVDLVGEFRWPATLEDLRKRINEDVGRAN
ncbi:MAG: hypothetical protein IIA41_01445 [SAR324 cluster bacterium]|nr:hypothetical protein [SAR324 cluster bacterium]